MVRKARIKMLDGPSMLCSLHSVGGNHPELWMELLFTSSFLCQKPLLYSVSGSCSVSHLYFNLWELGVLSVFSGLYFWTKWTSMQWLNTCQYFFSQESGTVRQQWLDIAVSGGVFLMGSVARALLSVVGTVFWGFCLWRAKMLWLLSMYSNTGNYLCSFGTHLCLYLSQQEAERGSMGRGVEIAAPCRVAKGKCQMLTTAVLVAELQQGGIGWTVGSVGTDWHKGPVFWFLKNYMSNYHRLPFIKYNKNEYWKNGIQKTTKACKVQDHVQGCLSKLL